ncbi:MAG: LysM peptidoglycan-binding domain-containing protein [Bacteroidetes bacterium]|nr:LysM peptidoglycan-binding domain-containing protein [Bacteroidota bacterium]
MTQLKVVLGAVAFSVCAFTQTFSQAPLVVCPTDPIAATIDSLITIDNVVRFRNINTLNYTATSKEDIYNVPTFPEQVYKDRIAKINSPIPYVYNDQVRAYINVYATQKREGTKRIMGLSSIYLPMFEEVLEREKLPLELKYLAMVESALNPTAVSCAGATGLWQFMYNTGILYDLNVNSYVDDRRDPYKSTVAACQYFKKMYEIYHDWLLVIASYNCGPGNVNKAIIRAGGKSDFWSISPYLPAETRGYVPAFLGISYVMEYSREHNLIPVPPSITYFETDTVIVTKKTTFSTLSKNLDIPVDVLGFLNPTFKRQVIPAAASQPYALRLPTNKIMAYTQKQTTIEMEDNLLASTQPTINLGKGRTNIALQEEEAKYTYVTKTVKQKYTVRRGESLARVADKFNCTQGEIKSWNRLRSNKVSRGQHLTLYVDQRVKVLKDDAAALQQTASVKPAVNNETIETEIAVTQPKANAEQLVTKTKKLSYRTQKGESLAVVARKMNCTVNDLKEWNHIKNNTIHPNQTLVVYREVKEIVDPSKPTKIVLATAGIAADDSAINKAKAEEEEIAQQEKSELKVVAKKGKNKTEPTSNNEINYLYYTVRKGDTLYSIAKSKGTTIDNIKRFNNISSGKQLRQGLKLKVKIIG